MDDDPRPSAFLWIAIGIDEHPERAAPRGPDRPPRPRGRLRSLIDALRTRR